MTNTIELITKELPKYNGLTKSEKVWTSALRGMDTTKWSS